jgi:uncharacterized protein DUF6348
VAAGAGEPSRLFSIAFGLARLHSVFASNPMRKLLTFLCLGLVLLGCSNQTRQDAPEPATKESLADAAFESATYDAFRDALNGLKPGWTKTERGLVGPGGALVRLGQRHDSTSGGHVDVQFEPDEAKPLKTALWDCVCGFGASSAEKARNAAYLWSQTSAATLFEFKYSRRGDFADHYRGSDPGGFEGWHVITGPVMGYGTGDSAARLQQWYLSNSVLPALSRIMSDSIDESMCPHGVKIFLGGNGVAEVRLDGEIHDAASEALAKLAWPRLDPPGFVRCYVLVLHREAKPARAQ